jgi:acyl carrier protein
MIIDFDFLARLAYKTSFHRYDQDIVSLHRHPQRGELAVNFSEIQTVVLDALQKTNQVREDDKQLTVSPDALLFGNGGQLDSMDLVALIIDIEEALSDAGHHIILTNERAMSGAHSPFRDVPSLVAYIEEQLAS